MPGLVGGGFVLGPKKKRVSRVSTTGLLAFKQQDSRSHFGEERVMWRGWVGFSSRRVSGVQGLVGFNAALAAWGKGGQWQQAARLLEATSSPNFRRIGWGGAWLGWFLSSRVWWAFFRGRRFVSEFC